MGIFQGIKDVFTRQRALGESKLDIVTKTIETALVHPIGFVRDTQKAYEKTSKESLGQRVVGAGTNALLVTAPFVSGVKTIVGKAISTAFTKAPVVSTGTALLTAGVLTSSEKARSLTMGAVSSFPETAFGTGEKIGGLVEGETSPEEISEPEWYATARALGLGAGIALLASGAVYLGYRYYQGKLSKIKEDLPTGDSIVPENNKPVGTNASPLVPVTPETTTITTGAKTRRKGSRKREIQNIRQSVRVNVLSVHNSKTARYLNKDVLIQ